MVVALLVLEVAVCVYLLLLVFFLALLACAFLKLVLLSKLVLDVKISIWVDLPISELDSEAFW